MDNISPKELNQLSKKERKQLLTDKREEEIVSNLPDTIDISITPMNDATLKMNDAAWQSFINVRFPIQELHTSDKRMYPKICIENTESLMKYLGISVRYNEMSKVVEIVVPNDNFLRDTKSNTQLTVLHNLCKHNQYKIAVGELDTHLERIGSQNNYHPVKELVEQAEWDQKSRLQELYNTIETEDEKFRDMVVYRWMIMAIAAVYEPRGIRPQGVLVFQSPQGKKKTMWLESICGNRDWVSEGEQLVTNDKDSVARIVSKWIVELGEIDSTFRKQDISSLKAFITKPNDNFRPPYARKANDYDRRTVFFGSVNDEQFLTDKTGNRRFWTIPVSQINLFTGNVQQLWAEVYERYKQEERYWLTDDEQAVINTSNERFEIMSPVEEMVQRRFVPAELFQGSKEKVQVLSLQASEVGKRVLERIPTWQEGRSIGDALKRMGAKMSNKRDRTFKLVDCGDFANKVAIAKVEQNRIAKLVSVQDEVLVFEKK